jgi:dienelactone hydrolase
MKITTTDVFINTVDDTWLAGTFTIPEAADEKLPAVVMANGFANVRQMALPEFAQGFAGAGIATLAIDYRNLGDSDGMPRQRVDPRAQREDLVSALGWLAKQPGIDSERIGLWGSSLGGGNIIEVAAFNPLVKAVVTQVPAISVWTYLSDAPEVRARLVSKIEESEATIPITAASGVSVLGPASYDWHVKKEVEFTNFHNYITRD